MREEMTSLSCPYLKSEVELTVEREQHIAKNHPELVPEHRSGIPETLVDPDEVRRSLQLPSALLFSKRYEDVLDGKSIVVVVMTGGEGKRRNWVIPAYLTRKLIAGEIEWKRS